MSGYQGMEQREGIEESRQRTDRDGREVAYTILDHIFTVEPRYRDLKAVGKGSYGIVCSALDTKSDKRVAIKKITPMAHATVDAKHVLREIRLMRYLGVHPNIISLEDVAVRERDDELYIVMELLDSDLHRIIQSPQPLSDAHHRYFMFQLLSGVKFLHDNRIIHRDLKPGNLLVTKSCQLRITDFGLARERPLGRGVHPDEEVDDPMTEHVITRWYRPPELMLCPDGLYTYAVDLWSVGCIFAELLGRKPLFPGSNFVDQLTLIFDVVGSPTPQEVAHIRNNQARRFLDSMSGKAKVAYSSLFPHASEQAIDLLEGVLVFDPPRRTNVTDALNHPYFNALRGTEGLRSNPPVAVGLEFEFESPPMQRLQLKQLILQEVESFRREQRRKDREKEREKYMAAGGQKGRDSRSSFSRNCIDDAVNGDSVTTHESGHRSQDSSVQSGTLVQNQEVFRGGGARRASNNGLQPREHVGQVPFTRTQSEFTGMHADYNPYYRTTPQLYNGSMQHDPVMESDVFMDHRSNRLLNQNQRTVVQTRSMVAADLNRQRYLEVQQNPLNYAHCEASTNRANLMRAYSAGPEMEVRDRIGGIRAPMAGNPHAQRGAVVGGMYKPRSPVYKQAQWNPHVDSAVSDDDPMDSTINDQICASASVPVPNRDDHAQIGVWKRG